MPRPKKTKLIIDTFVEDFEPNNSYIFQVDLNEK